MEQLLTVNELADKLKINRSTVYKFIKQGMPYVTVGTRKRFNFNDVMEWLKNRG